MVALVRSGVGRGRTRWRGKIIICRGLVMCPARRRTGRRSVVGAGVLLAMPKAWRWSRRRGIVILTAVAMSWLLLLIVGLRR